MNKNRKTANPSEGERCRGLNDPVTLTECVQVAQSVVDDNLSDVRKYLSNTQMSMAIQLDILKEALYSAGLSSEEKFAEAYRAKVDEINGKLRGRETGAADINMSESVGDVEVSVETKED